ncbi:MAG: class I SAM-dependent methyltransferase [Candidatus Krumholzibacteriota bacterium]|nr:class I SAM-dependent methyltransferase [Candidatus Krumholzibacteriota bacterium]
MTGDPYAGFAERYDRFAEQSPGEDAARRGFLGRLAAERGLEMVLDCACGTGADLVRLHDLGLRPTGSDLSEAMLAVARRRLAGLGLDIPLVRADFRELPARFDRPFDAVLCLDTSLPHLLEEDEIRRALGAMRAVLRPGGVLVLSQGLTERQVAEDLRVVPAVNARDFSRVMLIDYGRTEWEVRVLDLVHTDTVREAHLATFRYRLLLRADYERLLGEAGFAGVACQDGWEGHPYDEAAARRLVIVAER